MPKSYTVTEIADRLGVKRHAVEYVIKSRSVKPYVRIGRYRIYDQEGYACIASELAEIKAGKGGTE